MKMAVTFLLLLFAILAMLLWVDGPNNPSAPSKDTVQANTTAGTSAPSKSTKQKKSKSATTAEKAEKPSATKPEATEAETTEPVTTLPKETEPEATKPVTTEPAATEPVATEPAPTEPEVTTPPETEPDINSLIAPLDLEEEPPIVQQTEEIDTGWTKIDGCQYYLNNDGSLHTGWLELDGARYYFYTDGIMATGCVEIPELGKRYFDSTGKEVVLVNPWNYVPEEYSVKLGSYSGYQMAKHIISPLKKMLADCEAAGHTAVVCSAYRSHSDQVYLHNRRIQRFLDQGYSEADAKREAARRVAEPGTSEHELGLALDIVDINYQNLNEEQENMPAQKWLMENCWKYGFILRYPNHKSAETGIIYEPWHYRYVGKELAEELHSSGLCLEEYIAQLDA